MPPTSHILTISQFTTLSHITLPLNTIHSLIRRFPNQPTWSGP